MSLSTLRRRHLPALTWSLVVAVLLLTPGNKMPTAGAWSWLDKPVHALLFAVHCGLLTRALSGAKGRDGELVVAALVSGCYAVLLEVAQIWVPRRSWEWWDLVAGFAGIAVVALLIGRRRARLRATF